MENTPEAEPLLSLLPAELVSLICEHLSPQRIELLLHLLSHAPHLPQSTLSYVWTHKYRATSRVDPLQHLVFRETRRRVLATSPTTLLNIPRIEAEVKAELLARSSLPRVDLMRMTLLAEAAREQYVRDTLRGSPQYRKIFPGTFVSQYSLRKRQAVLPQPLFAWLTPPPQRDSLVLLLFQGTLNGATSWRGIPCEQLDSAHATNGTQLGPIDWLRKLKYDWDRMFLLD